jgi:broad specificity phosphatase PhoE
MSFYERYNFVPPRGESWKEAETRLIKTFNKLISENEGKTFILVTHGGAIRILMPILLGVEKEESYKYDPDNSSISIFDYQNGKFSKIVYNDTSHLI